MESQLAHMHAKIFCENQHDYNEKSLHIYIAYAIINKYCILYGYDVLFFHLLCSRLRINDSYILCVAVVIVVIVV